MRIKYIIILYLITPDSNYSLSVREDIDFAKKYLQYHGISDEKLCTKDNIKELCSNEQKELCSARLLNEKMEFKQFDNPCYMDLNNFCESQDNIWAIKNAGPCVMNAEMRRYAKEIIRKNGEHDDSDTTTVQTTELDEPDPETTTDTTDTTTETTAGTETTTETETTTDTATDGDQIKTTMDNNIGKIVYKNGSEKVLKQESLRFPPMQAEYAYDKKTPCKNRIKPCPIIYYPVCLYYERENPNNVTYYHFINRCEAQQWSCYHPERPIEGTSSIRAGYCAHIQYINYARFSHTMSAWNHYGWLHGPWPLSRILKPNQRA